MHESQESIADRFPIAHNGAPDGTFSERLLAAQEQHDQDTAVLSVEGEIDLLTAPALREALLPLLERGTGPVVVDLTEVPFMDSSGVHALVDTHQRLASQNRRLATACREDGQVHTLLALVGLLDALRVDSPFDPAAIGDRDRLRPHPAGRRSRRHVANERPTRRPSHTAPANGGD